MLAAPLVALPLIVSAAGTSGALASPVDVGSHRLAGPATGQAPTSPTAKGHQVEVTLITGDTIRWDTAAADQARVVNIDPAPRDDGRAVQFFSQGTSKDFYVYPSDVAAYLSAGKLDRDLFNIPELVQDGLTDSSSATLPVIVTFDDRSPGSAKSKEQLAKDKAQLAKEADSLPATTHPVPVRTLNGAGVKIGRGQARHFWGAIDGDGTGSGQLGGGVKQVMLDRPVHAELDKSVPQIGAPQVWDAGYTGKGVTVAVLDTGIDSGHPDLAGKVTAETNFTDSDSATDHVGHGTHVASTIAGSGAASDGKYKGVAPDAHLMNGKILGDYGVGYDSWIIAGMEWAASNGADVVNMSVGACCGADGTDPLAQAVNQLTAQYDTLFVIAAGNSGEGGIGTPGVADAALTVGAVDKADQLADFSSRGPRPNDFAVKPNVTGPGVAITAARAAGTTLGSPVNDYYTTADGTSMATPHVAGAAALLAQARPGLHASALKNALASTAIDGGYSWREQGTGRVDVARAVKEGVYASAALDFGSLDTAQTPVERELTYTNQTNSPVTLNLDSALEDRQGKPVANLTLSAATVTVPAGGEATVTASIDRADYPLGIFGGAITASGGGVQLRTAVGFGQFGAKDVTIKVTDFAGKPYDPPTGVLLIQDTYNHDNPLGFQAYGLGTENGVATAKVPTGTYTLMANVGDVDPSTGIFSRVSLLMKADVTIDADATFTLDAATTVPVNQPAVPRDVAVRSHVGSLIHQSPNGSSYESTWADFAASGKALPVFVSPSRSAAVGTVSLSDYWLLAQPKPLKAMPNYPDYYTDAPAYSYHLAFGYPNGIPARIQHKVKRGDLVEAPARYHAENPDAVIAVSELAMPSHVGQGYFYYPYMMIRPGDVTQYYLADSQWHWLRNITMWTHPEQVQSNPTFRMSSGDRFMDSQAGTRRDLENWFDAPLHVGTVEVADNFLDYYQKNTYDVGRSATYARGGADGNEFVPATELMDNSPGHSTSDGIGGNWSEEWRGGGWASWQMWNAKTGTTLAPDHKYSSDWPVFHLSAAPTTYRLQQDETYPSFADGLFGTRPKSTTVWTFSSKASNAQVPAGYNCARLGGGNPLTDPSADLTCQFQPLIQLRYELGLDIHNRAPSGRQHHFTIEAGSHSGAAGRAPVKQLTVDYSTDGGHTWLKGTVAGNPKDRAGNQQFSVRVKLPRLSSTDGSVWLRVKAEDANGGTVTQTIQRAYLLK
ncbi:S8 family serine peptidase [Micromonospora sp. DT201]|uniref:S8 family serine peptidase n=1 Tax=Micromonospora sp. DT201 TaxID=3393442 RepID=UPI003CFB7BBC